MRKGGEERWGWCVCVGGVVLNYFKRKEEEECG